MEKESDFFLDGVVRLTHSNKAAPLFCMNMVVPGLGTFISSFMGKHGEGIHTRSLLYAFLQLTLTIVFMLGWMWSIYHGFLLFANADDKVYGVSLQHGSENEDLNSPGDNQYDEQNYNNSNQQNQDDGQQ